MAAKHLTEEAIQQYLDGNLSHQQSEDIREHIEKCDGCRAIYSQYKLLYTELKTDMGLELSPNFSKTIINSLVQRKSGFSFEEIIIAVVGIVLSIGATIYYFNFKPIFEIFTSLSVKNHQMLTYFQDILQRSNIDLSLLIFASFILLTIIVLDYIFSRNKNRLRSYFRIISVFS